MVFMLMLEYLLAAGALYLFYTEVIDPFYRQKPYFPTFRRQPAEAPSLDPNLEYTLRKQIRDLEDMNRQLRVELYSKQEDKL